MAMDMHPPPGYVQLAQSEVEPAAPVEPTPIEIDARKYIPDNAVSVTVIVTLTPPTGQALVYAPGYEAYGTVFKGARSMGDVRLNGSILYIKLYGATSFGVQYTNYRLP